MKTNKELAEIISDRLLSEWSIGEWSCFCDEGPDFDAISKEDVAKFIMSILEENQPTETGR